MPCFHIVWDSQHSTRHLTPCVAVFTSFPRIFADKNLKVYDVGQNAEHLSQTSDVADLCDGARILLS